MIDHCEGTGTIRKVLAEVNKKRLDLTFWEVYIVFKLKAGEIWIEPY